GHGVRGPAQRRHWRKLVAGVGGKGCSFWLQLVVALCDAARGAPGGAGRFIRRVALVQRLRLERVHEVFPPPIPDAPGFLARRAEWLDRGGVGAAGLGAAAAVGWAVLVVHALNDQRARRARSGKLLPTSRGARLRAEVVAARGVANGGKEVPRALGGALLGLPARGVAASVRALDIADERVAGWLADPSLALLPKAEWHRIGAKLVELGLAAPIADERIFEVGNLKALAGAFGAAKSGAPMPGHSVAQRLIIDMAPASSSQRTTRGDIGALGASPSWVDIPPPARQPCMTLAEAIPNELIGISGPWRTRIALRVIPMGWVNAVTVFQHCHRRLGFGLKPLAAGPPPEAEWRRGRPLPLRSKQLEQAWVQYYIDDRGSGEFAPNSLVDDLAGSASAEQDEQREAYARSGISVAQGKANHLELILERMGASVDGVAGRVGVTTEKLHLLLELTMWAIGQLEVTVKAMLVVLDRRRPRVVLVELFAGALLRPPWLRRPTSRRRWPGVIELGNFEAIDCERFGQVLEGFRRDADWVAIAAGSPCQDLSSLNEIGKGLKGERSKLFRKIPELIEAAERAFVRCVGWFVENVFGIGVEARGQFTEALGVVPLLLGAKDFTRVRSRCSVDLPCFARPIQRRHPPLRPSGLERAAAAAQGRWFKDSCRYQACNYEDEVLLWDRARALGRLPVAEKRGVLMGFDRRYCEAAVKDSVAPEEWAIIMEGLMGNAFCVQCVTFLLGSWLAQVGALAAAPPGELCARVGEREANWNIDADFKRPGLRHPTAERSLIIEFLRVADRGGAGVRLDCNAPRRARAWPRCRGVAEHRCRYLRLLDAQAVAAVCTKCRSSARWLQPGIRQLNALALATGCYPKYGCCDADDVPADAPSRWAGARGSQSEAVNGVFDWWLEQQREVTAPEPAGRALPIGPLIALAFSGGFVVAGFPSAAAALLAARDAHLRTGEILAFQWANVTLYESSGAAMIRLRDTKSQRQTGAGEFAMARARLAVQLLATARGQRRSSSQWREQCEERALGMSPAALHRVFADIRSLPELDGQKLTLRSWRRGGASADFRAHGSMETTLLRGRWANVRAARLRVQDAMAEATTLDLSPAQCARCLQLAQRV
ncbi:unnamed protein product, partial [Prorocentrum cordatum]